MKRSAIDMEVKDDSNKTLDFFLPFTQSSRKRFREKVDCVQPYTLFNSDYYTIIVPYICFYNNLVAGVHGKKYLINVTGKRSDKKNLRLLCALKRAQKICNMKELLNEFKKLKLELSGISYEDGIFKLSNEIHETVRILDCECDSLGESSAYNIHRAKMQCIANALRQASLKLNRKKVIEGKKNTNSVLKFELTEDKKHLEVSRWKYDYPMGLKFYYLPLE